MPPEAVGGGDLEARGGRARDGRDGEGRQSFLVLLAKSPCSALCVWWSVRVLNLSLTVIKRVGLEVLAVHIAAVPRGRTAEHRGAENGDLDNY